MTLARRLAQAVPLPAAAFVLAASIGEVGAWVVAATTLVPAALMVWLRD